MTNNESEYIIEQWKKMKYSSLEKKNDNELRNIVSNNAEKIMAIPLNPTTSQLSEMYQLTGENRAAGEILSKREAKSEKLKSAMIEWEKKRDEIPYNNFIKLKAASSANGQLVAAILEEVGDLSAEELAGWCDELAALEEVTFNKLLDELVMERVLVIKDGRYRLMHVCTQNLYPEEPVEWGLRLLKQAGVTELSEHRLILHIMNLEEKPMNAKRIIEVRDQYAWLQEFEGVTKTEFTATEGMIQSCLMEMNSVGVTQRVILDGVPFYYFYRLGNANNLSKAEERKISTSDGKVTPMQMTDEQCRNEILKYMKSENQPLLIREIKSGCSEIPVQQVTQSVHQMKRDGIVIRFEEGALGYFALAQEGER